MYKIHITKLNLTKLGWNFQFHKIKQEQAFALWLSEAWNALCGRLYRAQPPARLACLQCALVVYANAHSRNISLFHFSLYENICLFYKTCLLACNHFQLGGGVTIAFYGWALLKNGEKLLSKRCLFKILAEISGLNWPVKSPPGLLQRNVLEQPADRVKALHRAEGEGRAQVRLQQQASHVIKLRTAAGETCYETKVKVLPAIKLLQQVLHAI
jgi:hypothetical protein